MIEFGITLDEGGPGQAPNSAPATASQVDPDPGPDQIDLMAGAGDQTSSGLVPLTTIGRAARPPTTGARRTAPERDLSGTERDLSGT